MLGTSDLIIAAILFGLSKAKAASAASPKAAADALTSIAKLQDRANQARATAWEGDLEAAGASPDLARALCRWIGIESSGDPNAKSKLGERGLLQISETTAKEALSPAEILMLKDPGTSRADQAKIALKQYRYHRDKAKKYVKNWPGDDTYDSVWYAKMHHQRPADLSAAKSSDKLQGTAAKDSRALTTLWKSEPKALHRLAAANVVSWGSVVAP